MLKKQEVCAILHLTKYIRRGVICVENNKGWREKIIYRHFDLPASFPVIGLLGPSWQGVKMPLENMHFHNCLEIGFVYGGSGQCYIGDTSVPFKAPCLVIVPPNVPHIHEIDEDTVCSWKWVYTDPLQLFAKVNPRFSRELDLYLYRVRPEDSVLPQEDYPQLFALLEMIIEEMENQRENYQLITKELFQAFFLTLLRDSPKVEDGREVPENNLGYIAPAVAFISDNYMHDITVEQLAQVCHISTSHFRRIFKQILGWTPLEYLRLVRIGRACRLLYDSENSITDVGVQVGYPTPSSFTRQFRQIYGISPNQWRRKMRSEDNPTVSAYFDTLPPVQFVSSEETGR